MGKKNGHGNADLATAALSDAEVQAILRDGEPPLVDVDALDYGNIGSSHVAGNSVYWAGVGFRWHVMPHVSAGVTYEFPLMNPDRDIFEERVTVNISFGV